MKKSTLALSVIVALGAITTGGAWYTGKQAEAQYKELIEQANQGLKQISEFSAEIKDVTFDRGLFSSNANYTIEITDLEDQPLILKGKSEVFHGPLPLNRLMRGNIMPALLSTKNIITSDNPEIKEVFADKDILETDISVSYSGKASGNVTINPIKYRDGNGSFETSAFTYEGDFSTINEQKFAIPSIKYTTNNGNEILVDDISFTSNYSSTEKYPNISGVGPFDIKVKQIKLTALDNPDIQNLVIQANNMQIKGNSKINGERLTIDVNSDSEISLSAKENKADLGKFAFNFGIDLDAPAFDEAIPYLEPEYENSPEAQQIFLDLLAKEPKLAMNIIPLENSKGKTRLDLNINLDKIDQNDFSSLASTLAIFKNSSVSFSSELNSVRKAVEQVMEINPETKEQAETIATQVINEIKARAANGNGLAVLDNETIKFALNLNQGKAILNGKELSEQEIQMALFAIMIGAGALAQ